MSHPDAETIIQSFFVTTRIIKLQTYGLSHADSLLQLPFRGNCLNWVLGHIVAGRNSALLLLGAPVLWDDEELARYKTGSEAITHDSQALPLEQLLADLDESQQRIVAALDRMSVEDLAVSVAFRGSQVPLGQALDGLHWHETYHTGQLELLRQLAGTDDALI